MKLINLSKKYNIGKPNEIEVLKNVNKEFDKGKLYAIMGKSGAGKSTLISILGLLDSPTTGIYIFEGKNVSKLKEKEKAKIRNKKIGFVFQSYFLDNKLTAFENAILPCIINKKEIKEKKEYAKDLFERFHLANRMNHYPSELSGGEMQRVAIIRALINNPDYVIADEPTGNLDSKTEIEIFKLLKEISKEKCVIVVTHNEQIKEYCDVLYHIKDGVIYE